MSVAPQLMEHGRTATLDEPRARLKEHGLRCTPARLHVLALLMTSRRHLSIADAWEELTRSGSAIHPATVYRTLETLTTIGLVHVVHGSGPARYGITGNRITTRCADVAAMSRGSRAGT
ncbi:Fur family transcriptional regulator [Streptomyces sp. NPDC059786]|uniref:Fur family transcriptional regulator n=1 Tax=Streptomyces sp. NPDC059786 TaxID=3346946 RepID=UPI0036646945